MTVTICGKRYRGSIGGICGLLFVIFAWFYSTYCVVFVFIKYFIDDETQLYTYVYSALSFVTLLSLLQAVNSDPGRIYAVSKSMADSLKWSFCDSCDKNRPPRSHHCSRCGRCVRKMDHHCIWINNCVGEDNLGIFIRFTCYAWVQSTITLVAIICYYKGWFPECSTCPVLTEEERKTIQLKILILFPIVFWLFGFLSGMIVDRALLLAGDMTSLETMQNRSLLKARIRDPENPGLIKNINRAFGTSNFITWFIPCCCGSRIKPEYEQPQIFWAYEV